MNNNIGMNILNNTTIFKLIQKDTIKATNPTIDNINPKLIFF